MKNKILKLILILTLTSFPTINTKALSAKSAILYEPITGRAIVSLNENEKLPMASTTKIITAITAIENCDLNEHITVSKNAASMEGSSLYLKAGEKVTLEELLYGLMLSSGNDAATAIAEHISGNIEEFAVLMNETVKKAGAVNTNIANPSGLDDPEHYTTASDLAKITTYAMKNSVFKKIVSTKNKTITILNDGTKKYIKNHNKLLNLYNGAVGVKTGFTKKDGRCLVGAAERNGIFLISVTLNAPDDWNDHIEMFDYGFSKLLIKNFQPKEYSINLKNSDKKFLTCKSVENYNIPCLIDDVCEIKTILPEYIKSPVSVGQVVGREEFYVNNIKVHSRPIVSCENIDEIFRPDFNYYLIMIIKYFLPL